MVAGTDRLAAPARSAGSAEWYTIAGMLAEPERDFWHPPTLEGRTVFLRRHRPDDLSAVERWYRDPELARLTRYQTRLMGPAEIERFFRSRLLSADALAYAIEERRTGQFVGFTTFSALDADNGSVLFHITIGERDAWGRGLGTEAAELMLGHAFERLELHRVGLSVFAYNERAIRSYQKVGFRIEGRLREAILRDGRHWDEVQMGILRDEWLARRSSAVAQRDERRSERTAQPAAR
jgi:RimJ/RimL family protein N-acetyltransferase